jgi:hypothetical protein
MFRHTPQEIAKAKADARGILKAGRNLDELSDLALATLAARAEAELLRRQSALANRGFLARRVELAED